MEAAFQIDGDGTLELPRGAGAGALDALLTRHMASVEIVVRRHGAPDGMLFQVPEGLLCEARGCSWGRMMWADRFRGKPVAVPVEDAAEDAREEAVGGRR